ncbi:MAG: DNA polymerase III subunit delta' [Pseudomonadota bacterium]
MRTEILQKILPWQQEGWDIALRQFHSGKMPHAYILKGEADTGKRYFATMLAQFLLCRQPEANAPCGHCSTCQLNEAGNNPDLLIIEAEGTGKIIKVEQIRELKSFLETSSHAFGRRIIILDTAESLGISSANALLKGLEEPPADVLFLLLTDRPKAVLATIASRCQVINLPKPAHWQSLAWLGEEVKEPTSELELLLELTQGRPFAAREMHANGSSAQVQEIGEALLQLIQGGVQPLVLAARYAKAQPAEVLRVLGFWLSSLTKYRLCGRKDLLKSEVLKNAALTLLGEADDKNLPTKALFSLYNEVATAQAQLSSTTNPNTQLMLEDLFLRLRKLVLRPDITLRQ